MNNLLGNIFILYVLCAFVGPVYGNESPSFFDKGKSDFEAKRFSEAYENLFLAFQESPAAMEVNFYLGRAAFESGLYEEAVMTFDRMLIIDPDSNRVKLEIARAYLELGSSQTAKRFLIEVRDSNPPLQVKKNIQLLFDSIASAEKRHFMSGVFSLGVDFDDNVNVAPEGTTIDMNFGGGIIPVTLDQLPARDQIYTTVMALNHIYKIPDSSLTWNTTLSNYGALYKSQHNHDVKYIGLTSGLAIPFKKQFFNVQLVGNYVDVGHDRYSHSFGLGFKYTSMISEKLILTAGITGQHKNNLQDDDRDADNYRIYAGPIWHLAANRLTMELSYETENAQAETNIFDLWSAFIRYDHQLPLDIGFFASYQFKSSEYGGKEPLFNDNREDTVSISSAGFSKPLWVFANKRKNLSGQIRHTITRATSSIGLYEYDKSVTSFVLTFAF